ncbi:MAG: hypothetical protein H0V44_12940 [Planctomycetes bacterium]|nr:hypothetical protein [Planctomycetota bacterium]
MIHSSTSPSRARVLPVAGALLALASVLTMSGCGATTGPAPRVVEGQTFGATATPFRGRWWQHYERGVSWTMGGFWAEAEADFRRAILLRKEDSRRARTYGMHFVQCFVHRELGAVLIEQGRLDEAEREMRLSRSQEPSAKTDYLLARIGALRGAAAPAGGQPAVPIAIPVAATARVETSVVLQQVTPAADGTLTVAGRFGALGGQQLWALGGDGSQRQLPLARDGAFIVALKPGESLATAEAAQAADGAATPTLTALVTPKIPPPKPELLLDGPRDGAQVTGERAWYRFSARAADGVSALIVTDVNGDGDGHGDAAQLARQDLAGVQAGGTIAVPLHAGTRALRFTLRTGDASVDEVRTLTVVPTPDQDRSLRATALVIPLQAPTDGGRVKPEDDPELLSSVSGDGRFRIVDPEADALLGRELRLVEAGLVDRVTAAEAGQRLKTRYVLTGTLRRGRGDVECFVRLVHSETGQVVASADAYAEAVAPAQEQAFFALVAGRLRQEFPVLQGTLASGDGGVPIIDRGRQAGVVGRMRFFQVQADADLVDPTTGQVLAAGEKRVQSTLEVDKVDDRGARLKRVSGVAPAAGAVVSE